MSETESAEEPNIGDQAILDADEDYDAPEAYARIAELEVHIVGGASDNIDDVSRVFDEKWEKVVESYVENRESTGWE